MCSWRSTVTTLGNHYISFLKSWFKDVQLTTVKSVTVKVCFSIRHLTSTLIWKFQVIVSWMTSCVFFLLNSTFAVSPITHFENGHCRDHYFLDIIQDKIPTQALCKWLSYNLGQTTTSCLPRHSYRWSFRKERVGSNTPI